MQCPRCRLINPDTALRCDCGYDFETQRMQKPYSVEQGMSARIVTAPPKGILALGLTGAIPLTLAGLAAALFIFLFSDDPNVPFVGWLLRAGGVFAVFEALAWLPLWGAWKLSNRKRIGWAYVLAAIPSVAFVLLVLWFHKSVSQY